MNTSSMTIDGNTIIRQQLELTGPTPVVFPDGRTTVLTPAPHVVRIDDPAAYLSLDGDWRVARWPFEQAETELAAPATGDVRWEACAQPGKVFTTDTSRCASSMPGWDRIGQTHLNPEDGAVLRRTVVIPQSWAGKRIHLAFDGIYPGGRVYLDGSLLGEHTSGLTPVQWDVTHRVTAGQAVVVAVRLLRYHPFIKMDMPRHAVDFAGLSQSAYFHATEPCRIQTHHLVAELSADCAQGMLAGTVSLHNLSDQPRTGELAVHLADAQGRLVATQRLPVVVAPGAAAEVVAALAIERPQLWNDEFPHLYKVSILLELDGQAKQSVSYRCGFRRLDFPGGRPHLNGHPVKFRGVNHLTYHPEHGLHTPADWLRRCLMLMKRANVNCIRTHFAGARYLTELCDELGIYLMQEVPIDWGTDYIADPLWVGPALQRIQGVLQRDRHHASLMVWSLGNENMPSKLAEAEDAYNHLRIYDRFAKHLDPTRPTMFPPPGPANSITGMLEVRLGDIADTHYSFKRIRSFLETGAVENPIAWDGGTETTTREEALARGWNGSWFSSEYGIANLMPDLLHAPYVDIIADVVVDPDSGRSTLEVFTDRLRHEWGFMRDEPTCLGGAYFPWICSAAGDNPWGWTVWGEDNDWGVVTADLLPKPFFWALRVLFSPVWFPASIPWRTGDTSVRFSITNQFNAIDLSDCKLRAMLGWAKSPSTRDWRDLTVSCPPGESCTVEVEIWPQLSFDSLNLGIPTVLRIVLLDPKGFHTLTTDIMLVPEKVAKDTKGELFIGPDVTFG